MTLTTDHTDNTEGLGGRRSLLSFPSFLLCLIRDIRVIRGS